MFTGLSQPVLATPVQQAENRLADARARLAAREKALVDLKDDQTRRRTGLGKAQEAASAGSDALHDMASEKVVYVGARFEAWKASKATLAKTRDAVKALKEQIARGSAEQKHLEASIEAIKADIALCERAVAQFGRLLTLPVRLRRRRARRNAD